MSLATEEIKSELKRVLLMGDFVRAEQILRSHPEAFTQTQISEIMDVINRARFGVTDPEIHGRIIELAKKLSS